MAQQKVQLNVKALDHFGDLNLPSYETSDSAGMDLRAALKQGQSLVLKAGERQLIPTGLIFQIPRGFEGQIRPRSGLAFKNGVTCLNTPGTIDADYRGEVKVLLINLGKEDFAVERGMRIAQMVIAPVTQVEVSLVVSMDETDRGNGGFGSTGVS